MEALSAFVDHRCIQHVVAVLSFLILVLFAEFVIMLGPISTELFSPSSDKQHHYKKRKMKKEKSSVDQNELRLLENIVFGDQSDILKNLDRNVDLVTTDVVTPTSEPESLFVLDRAGDQKHLEGLEDLESRPKFDSHEDAEETEEPTPQSSKSAWHDDDDDIKANEGFDGCKKLPKLVDTDDNYKEYLERKFTLVYDTPAWAKKALEKGTKKRANESDSESDDDILERTAKNYQSKKGANLLDKDFLQIKKCTHLNQSSRVRTSLNCIQFHPNSTVALLGSHVGLVRLFKVDGKENSIIQSIYFRGYKLSSAKFLSQAGREEIIVGSDGADHESRGYAFSFDMLAGKILRIKLEKSSKIRYSLRKLEISPDCRYMAACDSNGFINILSTTSKEHVAELKMNGEVDCLAFSSNSNYLLAHGRDNSCQAYIWDVRNLRTSCVNRFNDVGTVEATCLATSPGGSYAAIGSNMGVVNLYKFDDLLKQKNPDPIRSVMNLTTAVTSLRFNHDEQLLMMASREKNDSIRFLNTKTTTVYKNFPLFVGANNKTYGRIYDVDISPNSGYASFATGNGTGHLFRIMSYNSY